MADPIDRQAAIDALIEWYGCEPTDIGAFENIIEKLPSAHGDAEFISWLLDEIWDDEMWELNYRAFPELLCRRLAKAGWLKEDGGKYVRLDK